MDFEALARHAAIGWDADGALVKGPAGPACQRFILDHPQTRHVVVTLRTHGLLTDLEAELAHAGFERVLFEAVLSVPSGMWLDWALQCQRRKDGLLAGKLLLPETAYLEWKGFACRQHGVTVLVDDDIASAARGCRRYGITLFGATAASPGDRSTSGKG